MAKLLLELQRNFEPLFEPKDGNVHTKVSFDGLNRNFETQCKVFYWWSQILVVLGLDESPHNDMVMVIKNFKFLCFVVQNMPGLHNKFSRALR